MANINQLCQVQLGHTARGRLEEADSDGVPVLQLRDTAPEGGMLERAAGRYRMDTVADRYWARAGDVLFRSRGEKNTATALGPAFDGAAVVVLPLVILRPKPDLIDSRYLAWFINQPPAQRHFDDYAQGGNIRMIPIAGLTTLDVPVPDLATQRNITEVDSLAAREFDLATRLAAKRRQLTSFALLERANRRPSHHNGAARIAAPRSGKQGEQ